MQNLRLSVLRSMDHYPLVLLALWSVVLLQFAQKTGSQSGEAAPSNTYDSILERGRNSTNGNPSEGIVRPGSNRTTPSSYDGSFCSLYIHELTLEYQGCVTNYPTISCTGRCHSEQRPNQFFERHEANADPFITTCKCCSMVKYNFIPLILTLDCMSPDRDNLTVIHITSFATRCGCASCY